MVLLTDPTRPASASLARRAVPAARRIPFTLTVVAVMLVAAVVTRALWSALATSGLMDRLAYGLPALQAHRWWTPVSGSFFAEVPLQYLPVAGGFLVLVGVGGLRVGARPTGDVPPVLPSPRGLGGPPLLA